MAEVVEMIAGTLQAGIMLETTLLETLTRLEVREEVEGDSEVNEEEAVGIVDEVEGK